MVEKSSDGVNTWETNCQLEKIAFKLEVIPEMSRAKVALNQTLSSQYRLKIMIVHLERLQ